MRKPVNAKSYDVDMKEFEAYWRDVHPGMKQLNIKLVKSLLKKVEEGKEAEELLQLEESLAGQWDAGFAAWRAAKAKFANTKETT